MRLAPSAAPLEAGAFQARRAPPLDGCPRIDAGFDFCHFAHTLSPRMSTDPDLRDPPTRATETSPAQNPLRLWPEGDVLVAAGEALGGMGIRRVAVTRGPSGWTAEARWTSRALKPYFSDYVVHQGHAYGFDGSILACVDVTDGQRKWKGGRYGHGQLLLLADPDLLLVLSERGEVALVSATPDDFVELARFTALKGKTWNHPVVVGDRLLVRNAEEMAAFRLALARAAY